MSKITKTQAILSLLPNAAFVARGAEANAEIEWIEPKQSPFSDMEIADEMKRLQDEYDAHDYKRKRVGEYPDFREYIDGIVKGDQAQVQAYIDACLAVKKKYPKPE